MLKTCILTAAAVLAFGAAPALAQPQSQHPATKAPKASSAPSATESSAPAAAVVTAPAVGVVVDPDTGTAVVVPVNPQSDVPPEVTVALKALSATGQIKPGQIAQIVVRHGNKVTQVIANAPIP